MCSQSELRHEFLPDFLEAIWEGRLVGDSRGVLRRLDEVEVARHEVDAVRREGGGQDAPQLLGPRSVGAAIEVEVKEEDGGEGVAVYLPAREWVEL